MQHRSGHLSWAVEAYDAHAYPIYNVSFPTYFLGYQSFTSTSSNTLNDSLLHLLSLTTVWLVSSLSSGGPEDEPKYTGRPIGHMVWAMGTTHF